MLCASLSSPIILSDGRVTTCTHDHDGANVLANVNEHSFSEVIERYYDTRYSAMADPLTKPACQSCFVRL